MCGKVMAANIAKNRTLKSRTLSFVKKNNPAIPTTENIQYRKEDFIYVYIAFFESTPCKDLS